MVNQPISKPDFWSGNQNLQGLMTFLPLAMHLLRITNKKKSFPVQVMVTDIRKTAGKDTDPVEANDELLQYSVNAVLSNWANLKILTTILKIPGNSVTSVFNQFGLRVYDAIETEQEGENML